MLALEKHLKQFVLEATNRPLGGPGSSFKVSAEPPPMRAEVELGFPAARSAAALAEAIETHVTKLPDAPHCTVSVRSTITAHAVQHGLKPIEHVKNVIAVASGKGGVGKSTVAVNLSLALAQEGATVGLLDADIYGPSQPTMLGLRGQRPESHDGKTMEPLVAHGIQAMSIGFLVDERQPMAWRGPMVTSALNQLLLQTRWRDLDYLLVDMPPGTGDIQLTLAQRVPVSGAVIVTTPQEVALADARKALEMFQKVNVPVLGVVENMSTHICTNCGHVEQIFGARGGERLSAEYSVPLLGQLPLALEIRETTDHGAPSVVSEPDGAVGTLFRALAMRVAGELAATGKDYSRLFPKITIEEG